MKGVYRFEAVLQQNGTMDAAYVVFPYNLRAETGRGRMHVKAFFDGVPYEGSIVNMGVTDADSKAIRKQTGKTFGDLLQVEILMAAE